MSTEKTPEDLFVFCGKTKEVVWKSRRYGSGASQPDLIMDVWVVILKEHADLFC